MFRLIDLTGSNPTRAGLRYPDDLLDPLAGRAGLDYAPDPRGLPAARAAVVAELARHGATVDPGRIVLTASTSEAYAFLFKVLCDPGDEVLVPVPSYPLFEILSGLEAVRAVPYPLDPHGGWSYDVDAIAARVTSRTRAVIVVSPNNPTGTVLSAADVRALSACCTTHGLALVADEVFVDYRLPAASAHPSTVLTDTTCLTVSLGGLSKAVGLPQLKLAWMAVAGPDREARDLLDRLELVGDSFLSVGTPIQAALPAILARGAIVRDQIRARVARQPRRAATSPRGVAIHPTARAGRRLDGGAARALHRQRRSARPRSAGASPRRRAARVFLRFPERGVARREPARRAGAVRARHRTDRRCDRHGI